MRHPLLLRRDSWTHFNSRSHRTLSRATPNDLLFGELSPQHFNGTGAFAIMRNFHTSRGSNFFRLFYVGDDHLQLWEVPQIIPVALVRSSGTPAYVGNNLVERLPESGVIACEKSIDCDDRQEIRFVGCCVIRRGVALGVSVPPHPLRVPLNIFIRSCLSHLSIMRTRPPPPG